MLLFKKIFIKLSAVLKRVGILLLDKGVALQKLQNVGTNNLPFRMRKDGVYYKEGSRKRTKMPEETKPIVVTPMC
ncbi:hypothetical protein NPIL_72601 [Nephila pilipes]|uniref:Uncharacterized protein n=1 Tax=Nephila pilipes TaxID=299642 RepID=A0A8X6UB67_NEPPI|nr:hypothetical protein NPIL_72601 [Nephila pilipes]